MIGAIPITITVSILRYRLWDVDIFIRRTLVYTTLTVTLLVIYAVLVFVLQAIFIGWLANASEVVLIITTLAVAGLINPLRKRIQRDIDRRFYRRNYDAQKILEAFGASTRSQANLNVLTKELIRVVQETLQPESVSLWLQNYVPNPDSTISQNAQPGTHSKSET
jgi:ABC-type protease/lipase transport system fused ATPase/permease subunit